MHPGQLVFRDSLRLSTEHEQTNEWVNINEERTDSLSLMFAEIRERPEKYTRSVAAVKMRAITFLWS